MRRGAEVLRQGRVEWHVLAGWREALEAGGWLELTRWVRELETARPTGRGRASVAWVKVAGGGRLVLKRWCRGGLLGGLWRDRFLGRGRFLRALEVAQAMRARGIVTPEPVALVLARAGPCLYRAWMASEAWEGGRSLRQWLAEAADMPARRALLAEALRLVRRMHDEGFVHPDLNVDNLLGRDGPQGREWAVVDLDRVRAAGCPLAPWRRRRALRRLHRSWEKHLGGAPDLAAFAELYAAGDRALARRLRRGARWARVALALRRLRW